MNSLLSVENFGTRALSFDEIGPQTESFDQRVRWDGWIEG